MVRGTYGYGYGLQSRDPGTHALQSLSKELPHTTDSACITAVLGNVGSHVEIFLLYIFVPSIDPCYE
jgi:hypothetical protein